MSGSAYLGVGATCVAWPLLNTSPAAHRCGCDDGNVPLAIDLVLIDCVDLDGMSRFWCQALDLDHGWTGPSGGYLFAARDGSARRLGLMHVEDRKAPRIGSISTFAPTATSGTKCAAWRVLVRDASLSGRSAQRGS